MAREESRHNPFRRRTVIGPGPRGRVTERTGDWRCRCRKQNPEYTLCLCERRKTAEGRVSRARKRFRVSLKRKRQYRKMYQAWVKEA